MGTGNGLYDLLNTKVTTRNRTGHNTHEEDGRLKYGGMVMASLDLLDSQVVESSTDNSVLGRCK